MTVEELQGVPAAISESWNSFITESVNRLARALDEWEICIRKKHKLKIPAYDYKPAVKRNLPYQRRNF